MRIDVKDIQPGDYVAVYNPMMRGHVPVPRTMKVTAVGRRVKAVDPSGFTYSTFRLFYPADVLAAWRGEDGRAEGDRVCAAAYDRFRKDTREIEDMSKARDAAVLNIIMGEV